MPINNAAVHERLIAAEYDHAVALIVAEIKVTEAKLALLKARLDDAIANR